MNVSAERPVEPASKSVFLVGMMGSGKSTVGRRLAGVMARPFVDADKELEARCGVPISTIFELEGEQGFRDREAQLMDELTLRSGLVLATGGGVVLREANRKALADRGIVIYLNAGVADLWSRLRHDRARPLLQTADPRARIAELVAQRDPLYRACAHHIVSTGRQPVDRVVREILACIGAEDDERPVP